MKDKIKDAFLEMLETTPIEKIKVKDIAEKCHISRQTFYYHYYDIFSILKYIFEQQTEKALEDVTFLGDLETSFLKIMNWFKKNERLVTITYNYDNGRLLKNCLKQILLPTINKLVEKNSYGYSVTHKQLSFISNFYFISLISFLFDWIENGMFASPNLLIKNANLIIQNNFENTLRNFELYNDSNS